MLVMFLPQATHGETKVRRTSSGSPGKTAEWGQPSRLWELWVQPRAVGTWGHIHSKGPCQESLLFQLFIPVVWWDQDLSLSNEAHSEPYLFFWAIQTSGLEFCCGHWFTPGPIPLHPTFPSLGLPNSVSTAHTAPDPAGDGNISSVFKMLNGFCQQCVSRSQP